MIRDKENIILPEAIQSVADLEWIARILSRGFLHGKHYSQRLGSGMEFQQYRPYVQGDDIRNIDWKMYAKTDKYYIRQTAIETDHEYAFIIDNTPSMTYREIGPSKLTLSKILVATISKVFSDQGDAYSLHDYRNHLTLGNGQRHWSNTIQYLIRLEPSEEERKLPYFHQERTIIWLSDGYGTLDEMKSTLKWLKNPKTEVIFFHIMGEKELSLDFGNNVIFKDLEKGEIMEVNTTQFRETYQNKINTHFHKVKNLCFELGVYYERIIMDHPVTETLRQFFNKYQYLPFQ